MINIRDQFRDWRKSSRSGNNHDCVEVGHAPDSIGIGDTKQQGVGPILVFGHAAWSEFLSEAKHGQHDLN
ncbi:DUF397 domain-containing protein [Actinomadura atramentaria]|uniref:DUF397 domain-containing protein n=1 Tax=Actinomadura atramentaria TaxID=1990 RepID=UPI00035D8DEA|nr:DUF397 domain-containing protein [Actinomadura atramentaria]